MNSSNYDNMITSIAIKASLLSYESIMSKVLKKLSLNRAPNRAASLLLFVLASMLFAATTSAQQAPPQLGQETKGTPAVDENAAVDKADPKVDMPKINDTEKGEAAKTSGIDSLLGEAKVKESKRENGQVYLIELEHSSGTKQYIEETDSDGKIESTSNDIEETPNLPKWKIGSW